MKTLKRMTLLLAIMSVLVIQAHAEKDTITKEKQNQQKSQDVKSQTPGKFVDNNKDGVCDNQQERGLNKQGRNFVDKNGDGTCDNRENASYGKGNRNGCGNGYKHRNGQGKGNCRGNGYGYQYRHGGK